MKFMSKSIRKNILSATIGASLCTASVASNSAADSAETIADALKTGSTKLHLRLRHEDVSQDGTEDAAATTLKTRLSYTSGMYEGFGLTVEMDDTTELFESDYSDGVTNNGTAVIADPEVTEINQAYISYSKGKTTAKWGQQRILLDNQRFVGGVGWRQDEQTYSGITIKSTPMDDLTVFYGYITSVERIFAEANDHNHDTHLLNVNYKTPVGNIIAYSYLIDNQSAWGLSSDTLGVRWQGKLGEVFSYNLEYATQSEAGDNPVEYTANYSLIEAIAGIPVGGAKLKLKAGYEVLGSDDGAQAFTTSLATLHAFQGWADKLLGTPGNGVTDAYVSVGSKIKGIKLGLIYHSLSSDFADIDYGTEVDFVAATKVGPVGITLKYSDYSADDHASDTNKVWLMAAMTF